MNKLFVLLLVPVSMLSQEIPVRRMEVAAPAVEFTTTSNASQVGVNLVLGYQFTVRTPVILTSLGAVLQGNSALPIFGALPASMPVGLWDDRQNLLVSATVSASDPLIGHFNYKQVAKTLLAPGVNYTVAGLVAPGWSVLSDVPDLVPGSTIVYGGPRSLASGTLAFPGSDVIGLRENYFGAGFTYTGMREPVAIPGRDRNVISGAVIKLDGSASFSEGGSPLSWIWTLDSKPAGSGAEISEADSPTPWFIPDLAGVYVARLVTHSGSTHSQPATVTIMAGPSSAAGTR